MKTRINFTGRKRILHNDISASLHESNGEKCIEVSVDLADLEMSVGAEAFLEAQFRGEYKRFRLEQKAGSRVILEKTSLGTMSKIENPRFSIIVADKGGKILAAARRIRPSEKNKEKRSILPVVMEDLGRRVWEVDFDDEQPRLLLNEQISDEIKGFAAGDPQFILSVYPAVLREILTKLVFIEQVSDPDSTEGWHKTWLKFAEHISGEKPPKNLDGRSEDADIQELTSWIELVVKSFTESRVREWHEFKKRFNGGDE